MAEAVDPFTVAPISDYCCWPAYLGSPFWDKTQGNSADAFFSS